MLDKLLFTLCPQLKVSQPDGQPPVSASGQTVTFTTTVTAKIPLEGTTPYEYYYPRTMTFKLQPQHVTLPDNGLVPLQFTVPDNATKLNVEVGGNGCGRGGDGDDGSDNTSS